MIIYKDYKLEDGTLLKENINDQKHLMWQYGGVPCIDANNVWDVYKDKISSIKITTKKGRIFKVD